LRERLAGQHMTALYRSNRRADALRAYEALRARLAEELGSDPSQELRTLHATILRGGGGDEGPERPVRRSFPRRKKAPAQLPPGVGHFTGRADELRTLTDAMAEPTDEPRVLVVTAAGGLGKTALVVRWAHSVAGQFPDGQVFLDLHGNSRRSVGAEAALEAVLTALGVAHKRMPATLPERVARYRTLLNGKRVLIVADDAGTVEQLLPLVPPTPDSQIVVTTRRRLPGLSTQHAVRELTLEPLPHDAARDLLARILGPDRLRDPAVDDVVRWCGGWPLALRLAGAKLAARPSQPAASFAEELWVADDGLVVDGDPRTVPGALTDALRGLSPAATRLFGRLSRVGTAMSLQLVAAAAEASVRQARELLDELIAAHLIVENRSGRFQFHDLVRRFAGQWGAEAAEVTELPLQEVRDVITMGGAARPQRRLPHPIADSQRI
ncbi:MAG TPA: BTAD domain-containing putative transcriptional regulator, partial [Actinophytocola sp.]|nr:BTAD domain-containing putative transcriptional regulator [Actinophytocola sp.]